MIFFFKSCVTSHVSVDCCQKVLCPQPGSFCSLLLPCPQSSLHSFRGCLKVQNRTDFPPGAQLHPLRDSTKNPAQISELKPAIHCTKVTLHNVQNILFSRNKKNEKNKHSWLSHTSCISWWYLPPHLWHLSVSSFIHTTMECSDYLHTEPSLQANMNNLMSPHIRAFLHKKEWKSEGRTKLSKEIDIVLCITQFSFIMFQSSCILNY